MGIDTMDRAGGRTIHRYPLALPRIRFVVILSPIAPSYSVGTILPSRAALICVAARTRRPPWAVRRRAPRAPSTARCHARLWPSGPRVRVRVTVGLELGLGLGLGLGLTVMRGDGQAGLGTVGLG